jgi:hypothetical protein
MKRLLLILIITLNFQLWTKADDLRDFEIEGVSIGDSALDFISKKILKDNQKDWFKNNKYSISADLKLSFLKNYDGLQFVYLTNDKRYKLEGIEAIKFYQYDIEKCHSLFDEVSLEIQNLFSDISVSKKSDYVHPGDESGKTIVTQQDLIFPNGDTVSIFCENWSKESGFTDALRISIRKSEYKKFLQNSAY